VYIRHVIDQAVLLREMPESVRAALADAGMVKRYRAGEYLWRVGDAEDSLQVVADGTVHIGVLGPDGEEIVLHVVARGGCMGEPSVYSPEGNRKTDGRAVGRTTVVEVPGDAVRAALETSLPAMRAFIRRVSEITRAHSDRVALTAFYDARSRLARLLCGFAESHGVPTPQGRRIELPLSQRTLAGLVGVRRESVNRLIAEFERQGALRFEDGIITILKEQVLRSVPGVESTYT
jgi:CRP/FNR family cyclic AMP-dependent transcriptional regulator